MTPEETPETEAAPTLEAAVEQPAKQKVDGQWRQKIEACRVKRDKLNKTWQDNVAYRKNRVFKAQTGTDEATSADRIAVPVDWARTKNKQAQLFFQVPEVKLGARNPAVVPATGIATAALNFELHHEMRIHHMMDEVLGDVINAAGIAFGFIGYDVVTEPVTTSTIDEGQYTPEQLAMVKQQMAMSGQPTETTVQKPVYQCYYGRRISPSQAIFPADFIGTDWQTAPFLGYEGRISLAEALRRGWVDENYKTECADKLATTSDNEDDPDSKSVGAFVRYSELWYRRSEVDAETKDPRVIYHVVIVEGKDKPVKDEPMPWQEYNPETKQWMGLVSYPIKVLTITSVSDEAIPPSDSEIGRPMVRELNDSRTDMIMQRKRSAPMRWYDVNYVDEVIADQLDKGTFQGIIPMNGPGDNAIGEVARAAYPRESFEFQDRITGDLDQAWSMGANQMGFSTAGDTTAAETNQMATAAQVRLEYERARVLRFFVECAEATFSLMQRYQDDQKWVQLEGPNGQKALASWDRMAIRGDFAFELKPDAAQRIDASQKRVESLNVYKLLRNDPQANGEEILKNVLMWHGFDITRTMTPPPPPQVHPATLRYTFKGEDLTNPMVVALIQKNDPTPLKPSDLEAAKKLMKDAGIPEMPPEVMPTPQAGMHGQLPTPDQVEDGTAKDPGGAFRPQPPPEHPGPPDQVEPLNQRYGDGDNPREGGE